MGRKNRRDKYYYDHTNFHKLFVELSEKQEKCKQQRTDLPKDVFNRSK